MGSLGAPELILIFLVILIFFGANKIPDIARGFGKGIREFKKASRDIEEEIVADNKGELEQKSSCPFCSASVLKDAKFCPTCGRSLVGTNCIKCNTLNAVGAKFCKECGNQLAV
jgi:TatA/E family protein of Tat protein translocase